jgi:multiple sugar transport system substrate-binding protein
MMMKRKQSIRSAIGAAMLAGLLIGPATAQSTTTLNLWLTGPGYDRFLRDVVPEFEKANQDIKVEWLNLGWDNYQQKILTAFAGGGGPDVFSFYSVDVAPWAARNLLRPLDDMINKSDFIASALASAEWDGHLYAIPLGMRMRPLFYRKDVLAAAGFNRPPQTWEELESYAKKLVKRDANGNLERVGFWIPTGHPYKTPQVWLAFLWNAGGEVLTPDGKKAAFNSPEGVKATEFMARLLRDDKIDAPGSIKVDNTDYAQGRAAMLISNIVTRGLMKNTPELRPNVGIALPPAAKQQYVEIAGEMLGIARGTKYMAQAQKLASFIGLNPAIMTKYVAIDDTMPALKSVADSDFAKNNPWIPSYLALADHGRPLPSHPRWVEISNAITQALDQVFVQGRPAKEALDEAAATVNGILARS